MSRKADDIRGVLQHVCRFDADESAFLARDLESISTIITQTRYPDLKALDLIPMIGDCEAGAQTYTWRRMDKVGKAKFYANKAKDIPSVDVNQYENSTPVRTVAVQFGYSVQDLKSSALARKHGSAMNLDQARALMARLTIDRGVDDVLALGSTEVTGITGFANNTNVNIMTPVAGSWGTPSAPTATADQILQDMLAMERQVISQSLETSSADTLVLPIDCYLIAGTMPIGTNRDKTVLSFFKEAAMSIKTVTSWYQLTTAGAGSVRRAVAYRRDPMVLGALLPVPFEMLPPQADAMDFNIPCFARVGGTVVRYPLGMVYMDGL